MITLMGLPSTLQRSKINAWWTHCAALHHTWLVVHNDSSSTIWGMMQAAGKTLRTIYWIAEASTKTGIIYEIQRRRIQVVVSCDNRMQMIQSPMQWEGETHIHTQTEAAMDFCKDGVFFKTFLRSFLITLFFENLFSRVIWGPRNDASLRSSILPDAQFPRSHLSASCTTDLLSSRSSLYFSLSLSNP